MVYSCRYVVVLVPLFGWFLHYGYTIFLATIWKRPCVVSTELDLEEAVVESIDRSIGLRLWKLSPCSSPKAKKARACAS